MSPPIVYLVTGANRGIGLGMVSSLLLRPNTTVVGTIRSDATATDELKALPAAEGSQLIVLPFSSTSDSSAESLIGSLAAHDIAHIDTIIANAGSGTSFHPILSTTLLSLRDDFEVNTLGPIKLFQASYPLLKESPKPKFVLISSSLGSIGGIEPIPNLSYGVSKAAANFFVKKIQIDHNEIASAAIHPGWVKTANGQNFADAIGVKEPPMTIEQSVNGVLAQVDALDKSSSSNGEFLNYDGTILPW